MNFFLDTNVLLGYIFETDNWNSKALDVINYQASKYSSLDVCKECTHRYESTLKIILAELRKFGKKIRLSKSLDELKSYLQNEYNITGDVLLEFLSRNDDTPKKELIAKFTELQRGTEARCHINHEYLLNAHEIL
jgi:predicted nucleic acid-binding protein